MSLDYTDTWVAKGASSSLSAAGTTTQVWDYIFSKSFNFKVLHAQIYITTVAANASGNTFKVQLSDSAGSFASATDLASISITSSHTAGTMLEVRVADGSTDVIGNGTRLLRVVHVPGANDATLAYRWEVTSTPVAC